MIVSFKFLCIVLLVSASLSFGKEHGAGEVTYDGRSLLINGKREILISGSIHYPRSVPEMWPELIAKAKAGGVNVIQTYVFWNGHESVKGQYYFEGRFDLVKFIKEIQRQGLHCTLRIGPFIQAEWHHGGFPYWLRDEPGIVFRTDNGPFKYYMRKFVKYIVDLMKKEKLFAPQGGPIILAQIENEYDLVKKAFRQGGDRYLQWAGNLAINSKVGVPWMMCKQTGAPGPIISSCNGRNCGDTFRGGHPSKPLIWAEDWTAQFRAFGDPPSQRSTEDLAYGVARFFSKNGTLINYYMYHGGTNFGRTAAPFVTARYYDEAPLDEFGLIKEPKYGHLSDLHYALRLSQKPLLNGEYSIERLGKGLEARIYQGHGKDSCVAFLSNDNAKLDQTVTFRGQQYFIPRHSISILVDCKTVAYNTQRVSAQHNSRTFEKYKAANKNNEWQMYQESIPRISDKDNIYDSQPMELFNLTKDETDYVWYTTNFNLDERDMPRRSNIRPVVQIASLGHAMIGFSNDEYIGDGHGNRIEKSFVFSKPMKLKPGVNHLAFLGMSVGHPDGGAYLEHRLAGLHTVAVQGLNTGTFDLTLNKWGHKVGLDGEKLQIYTEERGSKVKWKPAKKDMPVTWYKRYFDAPNGDEYVALNVSSMAKGMVWINGENIGRFWVSYLNPLGEPTQDMYHIPRSLLKRKDNLIVVFEESGGNPEKISFHTVNRDNICSIVSTLHPGDIRSWKRAAGELIIGKDMKPEATLECYDRKVITKVVFADFGNPVGNCGDYAAGSCTSPMARDVVEKECLGKNSCKLVVDPSLYGGDPQCPGTLNSLAVHVKCSGPGKDDD